MTNKESPPGSELVEALRECAEMVREGKCEMLSEFWHDEAAKLTAEACAEAADRLTALEAENAKLRVSIDYYEIGVTAVGVSHEGERKVLHDCVMEARRLRALTAPQGGDHGE